jgi:hypothetical protein
MKKRLLLLGITLLVLSVVFSGCTDNTNESSTRNTEKILGKWTATIPNTPLIITMNFVTNTIYYESMNETRIWGTYTMTEETITLQSGGVPHTFHYSFSNDQNTLSLLDTNNREISLTLTRGLQ